MSIARPFTTKSARDDSGESLIDEARRKGEDFVAAADAKASDVTANAINELTNPTRVIPTTVVIKNGMLPRLPVKTAEPIPKGRIFEAMAAIDQVVVEAPIKIGDVVIENLLGLGINVVSTKNMDHC